LRLRVELDHAMSFGYTIRPAARLASGGESPLPSVARLKLAYRDTGAWISFLPTVS
jgi:hypothetical protein